MRRRRDVNPIDVVEAAYNLDTDDQQWLRDLAMAVRPLLDRGRGMLAYYFDVRTPIHESHASAQLFDIDPAHLPVVREFGQSQPDLGHYVHFHNEGLLGLVDIGRRAGFGDLRERESVATYFRIANVSDYAALQTVEPGGRGVVFAAGQPEVRTFERRTRTLWSRVTAHIAAGRRLRAAMHEQPAAEEAVLKPNGTLEHAEGEATATSARTALHDAVLRIEKARGKQRKADSEAATEAWTALVAGRWSLVDRFERNGRRYIVARRNEHALPDPRALTPRERAITHLATLGRSNKLIGYELGLSESTIASHLSLAMRKLGTRSRVELIQLVAQLAPPTAPSDEAPLGSDEAP